jgi:uncharacterized protein YjbJ (UPF0337 family)
MSTAVVIASQIGEATHGLDRVEGNWKQMKGKIKEQWGKLTDDDLDVIDCRQDQLEGRLQQRYDNAKDQATKEVNDWYSRQVWDFASAMESPACAGFLNFAQRTGGPARAVALRRNSLSPMRLKAAA